MRITYLTGEELARLREELAQPGVYALRVSQSETGLKFKINGGTWTPEVGEPQ